MENGPAALRFPERRVIIKRKAEFVKPSKKVNRRFVAVRPKRTYNINERRNPNGKEKRK